MIHGVFVVTDLLVSDKTACTAEQLTRGLAEFNSAVLQVAGLLLGYPMSYGSPAHFRAFDQHPQGRAVAGRGGDRNALSPWTVQCAGPRLALSDLGGCSRMGIEAATQPLDGALDPFAEVGVARARRLASSRLMVPSTLLRASNSGSSTEQRTSTWAAKWNTTSGLEPATHTQALP